MKQEYLEAARKYYKFGWSMLPMSIIEKDGDTVKQPMVAWKLYQEKQPEWQTVYEWLEKGWFLGLITGEISGVVVIDDDRIKHGLEEYGFESSVVAKSRSGGKHYYFKSSPEITNTANAELHVDVRGRGGYVVLPPFEQYEWVSEPSFDKLMDLTEIPDEIIEKVYQSGSTSRVEPVDLSEIVGLSEGARDNKLLEAANSLCNKHNMDEWDSIVFPTLVTINQSFNPPLPERDVRRIFDQARNFVLQNPVKRKRVASPRLKLYSEMGDGILKKPEKRPTMPVGVDGLDSKFDFPTGNYIIFGHPGSGKGFLALWLARRFYELHGRKTAFFSLEMTEELVRSRILQAWSDLTQDQYERGGDVSHALELLSEDAIAVWRFGSDNPHYQTPEQFKADVAAFYEKGFRVIMFDHLHELSGMTSNESNMRASEEWSLVFKQISEQYDDLWLLIFAQPNSSADRKNILKKNDVYGSKILTKRAEIIISINRKQDLVDDWEQVTQEEDRQVLFYVAKTRITSNTAFGVPLHFSETGNFYEDTTAATKKFEEIIGK